MSDSILLKKHLVRDWDLSLKNPILPIRYVRFIPIDLDALENAEFKASTFVTPKFKCIMITPKKET